MALIMHVALFLGCAVLDLVPELRDVLLNLLLRLYENVSVIGRGKCCGMPFLIAGNIKDAMSNGLELSMLLNTYDLIITGCPSCYRMFLYFYPLLNIKLRTEVKHIVQVIYEALKNGIITLSESIDIKVTYHDPCELARHMDILEEPRYILGRIPGLKLVELPLHGKLSTCCGGGGMMRLLYPKVSQEIAVAKILNEVVPLNVSAIVTACPFCRFVLKDAIRAIGNDDTLKVFDISELVLMSMGTKK